MTHRRGSASRGGFARALLGATAAILALAAAAPVATAQSDGLRIVDERSLRRLPVTVDQSRLIEAGRAFAEVQIAQPEIAEVSPVSDSRFYLIGRSPGRTTLTLLDEADRIIAHATVVVAPDLAELKERLAQLLPGAEIEVRANGSGIVLSGDAPDAPAVERAVAIARAFGAGEVTNMLRVGARQQVSLQVRIAEISRSAAKALGLGFSLDSDDVGVASGGVVENTFAALGATVTVGDVLLGFSLDLLEEKGFARVLAEPNLVALSGGRAEFLAGGEVPIPIIDNDGDVNVEFRSVGVSLGFEPTVLGAETISIALSAEVADIDGAVEVLGIPGFLVRRAATTVQLRDGQSFAIAGLYQEDFADNVSQAPWIGDLPVLGTLFRSTDFQRGETELVVIVSATLVSPVSDGGSIPTPLDRVTIPNERELFLLGRTTGADDAILHGAFGYVLE